MAIYVNLVSVRKPWLWKSAMATPIYHLRTNWYVSPTLKFGCIQRRSVFLNIITIVYLVHMNFTTYNLNIKKTLCHCVLKCRLVLFSYNDDNTIVINSDLSWRFLRKQFYHWKKLTGPLSLTQIQFLFLFSRIVQISDYFKLHLS